MPTFIGSHSHCGNSFKKIIQNHNFKVAYTIATFTVQFIVVLEICADVLRIIQRSIRKFKSGFWSILAMLDT